MVHITRRRIAGAIAGAAALTAALLAVPTAANAASVPTGSCGSGYTSVKTYNLDLPGEYPLPYTGGHLYVYYSAATGKNCAIARPQTSWAGKVSNLWVCISQHDAVNTCDGLDPTRPSYHYYAGPVYVSARHTCIDVRGGFTPPSGRYDYIGGAFKVLCA